MKKIISLFFLLIVFSCSKVNIQEKNDNNDLGDFSSFIDAKSLRIFAKEGVSELFFKNVGKAYEAMFEDGSKIDKSMRLHYFSTSKSKITKAIITQVANMVLIGVR